MRLVSQGCALSLLSQDHRFFPSRNHALHMLQLKSVGSEFGEPLEFGFLIHPQEG